MKNHSNHDSFHSITPEHSADDLYMYSHEGEPLIRKLAPQHPLQQQHQQQQWHAFKSNGSGCSVPMVMAGFLFLLLFLILSPPSTPWSSKHLHNESINYFRNSFRPFHHPVPQKRMSSSNDHSDASSSDDRLPEQQPIYHQNSDCRQIIPAKVTVRTDLPGFSSYWSHAPSTSSTTGSSLNVTYDERSLLINGERTLFLSGSMHPVRATRDTWNLACDEAVRNGLNMITIYVFWSAHQSQSDQPLDWSLPGNTLDCENEASSTISGAGAGGGVSNSPRGNITTVDNTSTSDAALTEDCSCRWDLATAIRAAASRGLWIHIRLGPYDCAEYNYGGIPAWLPLQKPHMAMRRYDPDWMQAMKAFISNATQYLRDERLWAYQGGPIVLAQIENELGDEKEEGDEHLDTHGAATTVPNMKKNGKTTQDYANWCGDLATRLEPNVIWTMCNGLSAPQTISTCNGAMGGHSCSTSWLEQFGDSGRIQKNQPAFWTEAEQGFQIWGETPKHPSDYFWGTTSKDMAYEALRWFARGGASLNWYMWWGGYNRGRAAASGITNMYASDAPLCPSGQRRYPKFGHLQALHENIADVASLLLDSPTALFTSKPIEHMNDQGRWEVGQNQRVFVYRQQQQRKPSQPARHGVDNTVWREAHFVENDSTLSTVVRFPIQSLGIVKVLAMEPQSSALVVDGILRYDSAAVNPRSMSYTRTIEKNTIMMLDWQQWMEPRSASSHSSYLNNSEDRAVRALKPMEQTELTVLTHVDSDYVWYESNLTLQDDVHNATLWVDTQKANAFTVFIDGELVGVADNHEHKDGNVTLSFLLGRLTAGDHQVVLLSESIGYFNLIGRWGASTRPKRKGITGDVVITGTSGDDELSWRQSLLDGHHEWLSFAGLHGERPGHRIYLHRTDLDMSLDRGGSVGAPCTWTSALFDTPNYDPVSQALFVEITTGRGHLWLNGRDLGRFWNITRDGTTHQYTQPYYLLPYDFLYTDGNLNELIFFNALDGDLRSATLVMSWTQESDKPNFMDQVDFPLACI